MAELEAAKTRGSGRVTVLGVGFDPVSLAEARARAVGWLRGESAEVALVVTANPETVMRARAPELAAVLAAAHLVVADGVGVLWAARLLGEKLPGKVPGIELAEVLLEACAGAGLPVFFLGGKPQVAARAANRLRQRWPELRVVGVWHGYLSEEEERRVREALAAARPALLLCGMGCPRQELWLARNAAFLSQCGVRVAVGVGGAFDVWAGDVPRAPAFLRKLGLEWCWRAAWQPRRLRRQARLLAFALEVLRQGAAKGASRRWAKSGK